MCGLLEGRFEIALTYHLGFPRELEFETLAAVMPHAVLPRGHPLSSAVSVSLESLAREPMVLLDLPYSREYFLSLFRAVGLEPYVRDRTASFELVRGLVANGRGFSILNLIPRSGTTYEGSKVVCRPLSEQPSPLRVGLAQPAGLRLTHAARAFVAHCRCFFCQEATRPLLHPA
jgi:DNA-binding transcriptional LysR family regulator